MLNHYFLALVVTGVTHLVLAIFVYLKGPKKLTNVTYASYSAAISWWSCLEAFSITASTQRSALILWRLNHVGVIFIPIFFVHFVMSLLEDHERRKRRPFVLGSYAVGIFLLVLNGTSLLIGEVVPKFSFRHFINPGLFYPFFFLGWIAWAVYGLILLFKVYARSRGALRNQLRYFCWSMLIAYIGGAPNFLPTFGIEIPVLMPFGTYAIPAYAFVTTYAIVRYRLMDVNVALTRMALFIIVYAPLLILPVLLGKLLQLPLTALIGSNWWMIPMVFEALFAVGGLLAYRYVRQKAEDKLLAEQRRYQQLLVVAAEGMLKILDLSRLLRLIVGIVVKHVRLSYAALYLLEEQDRMYRHQVLRGEGVELPETFDQYDPLMLYLGVAKGPVVSEELKRLIQEGKVTPFLRLSERLEEMKAGVVVPAFLKNRLIGFMVLGQKLSGQMFTQEDVATFDVLAHQVAIAIQNARFHSRTVDVERLEAAGELLNAMGHEMGNVLHILTLESGTQLARWRSRSQAPTPEQEEQALRQMEATAIRGGAIINDVKTYRKQSEERGIVSFSVSDLFRRAEEMLKERFSSCPNIGVALELSKDLPHVEGHATLASLPLSLLAGSFWVLSRESEGGTILVSVSADSEKGQAEIRVTDPGPSLRPMLTEDGDLFPERSRHGGLYFFLVRKIVSEHNGVLNVLDGSQAGQGSMLIVRLPLKYQPPPLEEMLEGEPIGNPP